MIDFAETGRHPCNRCGCDIARPLTLVVDGVDVRAGSLCHACLDTCLDEAAALRKDFEALIAVGVTRQHVNMVMIGRMRS